MSKDTDQTPQCVKTDVSSAISSGNPHLLSEWNLKSKTLLYLLKKWKNCQFTKLKNA